MTPQGKTVWLVCNPSSGSNDEDSLNALLEAFKEAGLPVSRIIRFPDEAAPTPADLDAGNVDILSIFGGDGTIHTIVMGIYGWGGSVLVLPGGTMNLLAKRMHGDSEAVEIVRQLADGQWRVTRPNVLSTRHGIGLTGSLAGPGTVWNEVREAMRAVNVLDFVSSVKEAITESATGARVRCAEYESGREEGYAAISVTPKADGLQARGYYAESLGDYAGQGMALLNRNFRDGPNDILGTFQRLHLVSSADAPMGLLIDGEPFDGAAEEMYEIATCQVDLITTKEFDE